MVPVALTGDHVVWEEGAGRQVVSVSLTRKSREFVLLDSPYLTDPEAAVCLGGRGGVWGIPVTTCLYTCEQMCESLSVWRLVGA